MRAAAICLVSAALSIPAFSRPPVPNHCLGSATQGAKRVLLEVRAQCTGTGVWRRRCLVELLIACGGGHCWPTASPISAATLQFLGVPRRIGFRPDLRLQPAFRTGHLPAMRHERDRLCRPVHPGRHLLQDGPGRRPSMRVACGLHCRRRLVPVKSLSILSCSLPALFASLLLACLACRCILAAIAHQQISVRHPPAYFQLLGFCCSVGASSLLLLISRSPTATLLHLFNLWGFAAPSVHPRCYCSSADLRPSPACRCIFRSCCPEQMFGRQQCSKLGFLHSLWLYR